MTEWAVPPVPARTWLGVNLRFGRQTSTRGRTHALRHFGGLVFASRPFFSFPANPQPHGTYVLSASVDNAESDRTARQLSHRAAATLPRCQRFAVAKMTAPSVIEPPP